MALKTELTPTTEKEVTENICGTRKIYFPGIFVDDFGERWRPITARNAEDLVGGYSMKTYDIKRQYEGDEVESDPITLCFCDKWKLRSPGQCTRASQFMNFHFFVEVII